MILGLWWDKVTPKLQAAVILNVRALQPDALYWTGVDFNPILSVLGIPRTGDEKAVTHWLVYKSNKKVVTPRLNGEVIEIIMDEGRKEGRLRKPPIVTQRQREMKAPPQGQSLTYNPYDRPMPDPYAKSSGYLWLYYS